MRQMHHTCEICLQNFPDQTSLYKHCLTHSQELMCMKCFLTYENHQQFRKHLFYKHEEEHQVCEVCHQKTWPHVYHFCIEPKVTTCEVCEATFDNFRKYRVHLRTHTGATPYVCTIRGCKKSYVSKQLLLKHHIRRHPELRTNAATELQNRRDKKYLDKMGASSIDHVQLCQEILEGLIQEMIAEPKPDVDQGTLEQKDDLNAGEVHDAVKEGSVPKEANDAETEKEAADAPPEEFDPLASAIASIMGPDGNFDIRKSPVKPVVPPTSTYATPSAPTPTPIPMPPLIPVNGETPNPISKPPKASTSLLKSLRPLEQKKMQDPYRMMLEKEKKPVLPEPSDILPPSSYNDIVRGTSEEKDKDEEESKEGNNDKNVDAKADEDEDAKHVNPVLGGIWNQDLLFVSNDGEHPQPMDVDAASSIKDPSKSPNAGQSGSAKSSGCKIMKPRYQIEDSKKKVGLMTNLPQKKAPGEWEVLLSESSGSDNEDVGPKKPRIKEKSVCDITQVIKDHDYCYAAYMMSKEQPKVVKEDLSEMDKILSNVALGAMDNETTTLSPKASKKHKRKKESKKKKKKRKKHKKNKDENKDSSSSRLVLHSI